MLRLRLRLWATVVVAVGALDEAFVATVVNIAELSAVASIAAVAAVCALDEAFVAAVVNIAELSATVLVAVLWLGLRCRLILLILLLDLLLLGAIVTIVKANTAAIATAVATIATAVATIAAGTATIAAVIDDGTISTVAFSDHVAYLSMILIRGLAR